MKLWELEIKYETGEEEHITGFLSKKQIDDFVEQHKKENNCIYTKKEFEGTKLDATFKEFFEFFKISEQEITLEQRECLESILTNLYYKDEPYIIDGERIPNYGAYTISYSLEQWCSCSLCKTVKVGNEYYEKEINRGEGDSFTEALCSLLILNSDKLEEQDIKTIKEILK